MTHEEKVAKAEAVVSCFTEEDDVDSVLAVLCSCLCAVLAQAPESLGKVLTFIAKHGEGVIE